MCGIAGILAPPGQRVQRRTLERMIATLGHRGPDAVGYHLDGRVGLAVARLRVVDLETGDQPVATGDRSVHAALNGEIYNFVALRDELASRGHHFTTRSDTEVVAHAWQEYGEHCVDAFNGMFSLAVWDRRRDQLFLARDRMGEKPLYYAVTEGGLVFGSELRAVLAHPAVTREVDPASVARYLAYDFVPDPYSMVLGVCKLPPAYALLASDGKLSLQRYWDIPFRPDPALDEGAWGEEIARRLEECVRLRLSSDVPLGCFLSGGIDSTAIAALAARQRAGVQTFSVGYADQTYDERPYARLASARLGTRHEELVVTAEDIRAELPRLGALLDEPIADMSFLPLHLLARAARRTVTVALTGDGGDELFAGYPSMGAQLWHDRFAGLPRPVRGALRDLAAGAPGIPEPLRRFLGVLEYSPGARNQALVGGLPPHQHPALLSAPIRVLLTGFDPYGDIDRLLDGVSTPDAPARLIYQYCKLYLAGQNLANADRASMAASLELRAPFLDHTFVEFMGRVPSAMKLRGLGRLKALLKRALADRLPPEILARRKQGFGVPLGTWFRGPLAGALREGLEPARLRAGGVLEPVPVSRLVTEHVSGVRDHARTLWALLVFASWHRHHRGDGA